MSKTLKRVSPFLTLLLSTTKDQAKALLYTLTPDQVHALQEIAQNLLHLPLSPNIKAVVKKRNLILRKLADKSIKIKQKIALIENHQRQIYHTLLLVKTQLKSLIE
jgi:hypothetical protein